MRLTTDAGVAQESGNGALEVVSYGNTAEVVQVIVVAVQRSSFVKELA